MLCAYPTMFRRDTQRAGMTLMPKSASPDQSSGRSRARQDSRRRRRALSYSSQPWRFSLFDKELVDSSFYLKNNIHVPCPIPVGAVAPLHVRLHRLDGPGETRPAGRRTTIGELVSDAPLTAIIAGSLT